MSSIYGDLHDSYMACSWAISQLKILQGRIQEWHDRPAYLIEEELRPDLGKKVFKLRTDQRIDDSLINAEVGAIINSLRSSLDLLASALAVRNGKKPSDKYRFRVYVSYDAFSAPAEVEKRKKWLSPAQIMVLESLKPYKGGDDELFALHHLDIARKHERLVRVSMAPYLFAVNQTLRDQGFEWADPLPGFDDGAEIGRANINADAANGKLRLELEVAFNETELIAPTPIIERLRRFYGMADGIIQKMGAA